MRIGIVGLGRMGGNIARRQGHETLVYDRDPMAVVAYVLSAALFARYRSRSDTTFGDKVLSAMRHGFGGHVERPQ